MFETRVVRAEFEWDRDSDSPAKYYRCSVCGRDDVWIEDPDFRVELFNTQSERGLGYLCEDCLVGGPDYVASRIKENALRKMVCEIERAQSALKKAKEEKEYALRIADQLEDEKQVGTWFRNWGPVNDAADEAEQRRAQQPGMSR